MPTPAEAVKCPRERVLQRKEGNAPWPQRSWRRGIHGQPGKGPPPALGGRAGLIDNGQRPSEAAVGDTPAPDPILDCELNLRAHDAEVPELAVAHCAEAGDRQSLDAPRHVSRPAADQCPPDGIESGSSTALRGSTRIGAHDHLCAFLHCGGVIARSRWHGCSARPDAWQRSTQAAPGGHAASLQKIRATGSPRAIAPAYSACGPDCSG